MSKRPASSSTASRPKRSKRARTFGGPSMDDEDTQLLLIAPSSTALSTRTLPPDHVLTLTTLCARAFVANLQHLFEHHREETQEWIKILPEAMIPALFSMLMTTHPSLLSHPFISTFFLRGDRVVLSSDLPGVTPATVQAVSKLGISLRHLRLIGLDTVQDVVFSDLLHSVTALEDLSLRGCSKVNEKTVKAACMSYKTLKSVNLSYTSAPIDTISLLTAKCTELEVLKLAGVSGITDANFWSIFHVLEGSSALAKLRSLKLRHTSISEDSLRHIFEQCPHLSRLDVSFTPIRQPNLFLRHDFRLHDFRLHKLSITSTPLKSTFLLALGISDIRDSMFFTLRTLHIGALGASPSSSMRVPSGSLILTDSILASLTLVLSHCELLENVSLVGNTKLGLGTHRPSALWSFLNRVGRRCKVLNLAGIPRLKSSDLAALLPLDEQNRRTEIPDNSPQVEGPSPLRTLILNNTGVDSTASEYISTCVDLQTLGLAGTKFDYNSLFHILDACPRLNSLNLTSCRGVKVADRRYFFEVWEREWKDN